MSSTLSILVRAMATYPVARKFLEDYSDELAIIATPEMSHLADVVRSEASQHKMPSVAERSAGVALYRLIRDAFDATLVSKDPKPATSKAIVAAPLPPSIAAKLVSQVAPQVASKPAKAKGEVSAPQRVERKSGERATVQLPTVKVNAIPTQKLAAHRQAFFADARRVDYTQAALSEKALNLPLDQYYFSGAFKDTKKPGLDPAEVMRKHRDIIGSTPEGLATLTQYEHHCIGAYAALDIARRILANEHKGGHVPRTLQQYTSRQPNGTPTSEYRDYVATMRQPTLAEVRVNGKWQPLPESKVSNWSLASNEWIRDY